MHAMPRHGIFFFLLTTYKTMQMMQPLQIRHISSSIFPLCMDMLIRFQTQRCGEVWWDEDTSI